MNVLRCMAPPLVEAARHRLVRKKLLRLRRCQVLVGNGSPRSALAAVVREPSHGRAHPGLEAARVRFEVVRADLFTRRVFQAQLSMAGAVSAARGGGAGKLFADWLGKRVDALVLGPQDFKAAAALVGGGGPADADGQSGSGGAGVTEPADGGAELGRSALRRPASAPSGPLAAAPGTAPPAAAATRIRWLEAELARLGVAYGSLLEENRAIRAQLVQVPAPVAREVAGRRV